MRGKKAGESYSTKTSVAKLRSNEKADKTKCDKLTIRFRKGKKEYYHEEAIKLGYESFNQFVIEAVNEKIERGV